MIFQRTIIGGAYHIKAERMVDERGFFSRIWCQTEFKSHGINIEVVQASVSRNKFAGTVRGLHFTWPPSSEAKLVRCGRGKIFDVILDLRPNSASYREHLSIVLDSDEGNALFVPPGVAHGFQTLEDGCEVVYMMSDFYQPELAAGVRFDDPVFNIDWPLPVCSIIERDCSYPDFNSEKHVQNFLSKEAKR